MMLNGRSSSSITRMRAASSSISSWRFALSSDSAPKRDSNSSCDRPLTISIAAARASRSASAAWNFSICGGVATPWISESCHTV